MANGHEKDEEGLRVASRESRAPSASLALGTSRERSLRSLGEETRRSPFRSRLSTLGSRLSTQTGSNRAVKCLSQGACSTIR
jgi:hypothetical protein